jgi:hypothetical protein
LHLGISNPSLRVAVWLGGCAGASIAGAILGPLALVAVGAVLTCAAWGRLDT